MACTFDDSLPWLVEELLARGVTEGVAIRDASGRLSFVAEEEVDEGRVRELTEAITARLGPYARPDRPFASSDAPGAQALLREKARVVTMAATKVRYLDRRIIGTDWLRAPTRINEHPPRIALASLKGGVGRSTALSVVAAEQARTGHNVLIVDLDLEAPGVGSMLLTMDRMPAFGALDYLVERNLGDVADLDSFVGTSPLTAGAGVVDVVPVVGSRTRSQPENYLAKLSRGMLDSLVGEEPEAVVDKIGSLLDELEARRRYDVVLLDARSGLAELAAGPLLGLGARVLLFGTAQPQTLEGLRFLFAHLQSLVDEGEPSPWSALKMVHGKALLDDSRDRFRDDLWDLFSDYLYEEQSGFEGFNFDPADARAPHWPIAVPFDSAFADWDPTSRSEKLTDSYYSRTYGDLLAYVQSVMSGESS